MNGLFGVGPLEMVVIAVLALIFIGPQRLPGVIQQVMKTVRELREYASQVQEELTSEFAEMREQVEEVTRELGDFTQDVAAGAGEIAAETQQVADMRPAVNALLAPPPPREAPAVPAPVGAHTNGVSHDDEDARPSFGDYHPG